MARAAVVCVACLMLFVAVQACHGNCPTHSHDAGTLPLACECLPDAGYTFLAVANCPCGYGQVISDCTQCPNLMTNDEWCRIMAGPHGKDAGSSGPRKHCGCDAGYQLTSADGHDACIALAAKCSCTQPDDSLTGRFGSYIGWGMFFVLICCGDNILKCYKSLADQDDALATQLVPSDVEEPTPDSIAATKLERDRKMMRAMETYYQKDHFKMLVKVGWMRWEDMTVKNPPTTDPDHVSNPDGGDDPEYIVSPEKVRRLLDALEEFLETNKRSPSTNDPPYQYYSQQQPHADSTAVMSTPLSLSQALESGTSTTPASRSEPKDLAVVLQEASLSQYETALRELGAAFGADLVGLEEDDLVEIGMKKLEVKRLLRIAQQVQ